MRLNIHHHRIVILRRHTDADLQHLTRSRKVCGEGAREFVIDRLEHFLFRRFRLLGRLRGVVGCLGCLAPCILRSMISSISSDGSGCALPEMK